MRTRISSKLFIFGVPLLIMGLMVLITSSKLFHVNTAALSKAITLDLLLTSPLIYLFLIRKKNIPKITAVPVFVLGIIIASNIIPKEHQSILSWTKTWVFPIVELGVATFIFHKVRQTLKSYRNNAKQTPDFFAALKDSCREVFPGKVSTLLAMELAVLYYGFISWKKRVLRKNEFSYHKNSGTISLLVALIPIIAIETYVLHILLIKWSIIAAWIATILSVYSSFQIFGFLKSLMQRPFVIDENTLHLRYGILSEASIPISNIESITLSSKDIVFNDAVRKLSPLGELETHNVVVTLKKKHTLVGLYGIKKTFETLAFYVNDRDRFKACLEHQMNTSNNS